MKTKIFIVLMAVALVTLSFTFVSVKNPKTTDMASPPSMDAGPVGGIFADEVVE